MEVANACSISPIQPDRALLGVADSETMSTLCNIKGWFKVGRYTDGAEQIITKSTKSHLIEDG